MSKKALLAAAAILALPAAANAQSLFDSAGPAYPGVYIGAEGGLNWLLNNSSSTDTGYAVGGKIGYDFVGPRVELEGRYDRNTATVSGASQSYGLAKDNLTAMANLYYDFNAGGTIVPYIGAGAGIAARQ